MAGTVGEPGNRAFFLQARDGARIVSVALEKVQVAALAERLDALLDELERRGVEAGERRWDGDPRQPSRSTSRSTRRSALARCRWAGTVPLDLVLVEARAQGEDEDEEDEEEVDDDAAEGPDLLRVRLLGRRRGARVRGARGPCARRRPAAVPAVRPAARPAGPPLPAAQRAPAPTEPETPGRLRTP